MPVLRIDKFIGKLKASEKDLDKVLFAARRTVALEALAGLTKRTVVVTGRTKFNWVIRRQPPTQVLSGTDSNPEGTPSIDRGLSPATRTARGDAMIWVGNAVPWGPMLEDRNHMMEYTINELRRVYS